ncbi:MAG: hypothetical protein ACKO7B_13050 [Flavobacteriales bacterium]
MRSILFSIQLVLIACSGLAQCEESVRAAELALGNQFIADPKYLEAKLEEGDTLSFETVWHAKNTYRIATSANQNQRINMLLFDENDNLLYDNSNFGFAEGWTFFVEHSMTVRCVIRSLSKDKTPFCLTVINGFKK